MTLTFPVRLPERSKCKNQCLQHYRDWPYLYLRRPGGWGTVSGLEGTRPTLRRGSLCYPAFTELLSHGVLREGPWPQEESPWPCRQQRLRVRSVSQNCLRRGCGLREENSGRAGSERGTCAGGAGVPSVWGEQAWAAARGLAEEAGPEGFLGRLGARNTSPGPSLPRDPHGSPASHRNQFRVGGRLSGRCTVWILNDCSWSRPREHLVFARPDKQRPAAPVLQVPSVGGP